MARSLFLALAAAAAAASAEAPVSGVSAVPALRGFGVRRPESTPELAPELTTATPSWLPVYPTVATDPSSWLRAAPAGYPSSLPTYAASPSWGAMPREWEAHPDGPDGIYTLSPEAADAIASSHIAARTSEPRPVATHAPSKRATAQTEARALFTPHAITEGRRLQTQENSPVTFLDKCPDVSGFCGMQVDSGLPAFVDMRSVKYNGTLISEINPAWYQFYLSGKNNTLYLQVGNGTDPEVPGGGDPYISVIPHSPRTGGDRIVFIANTMRKEAYAYVIDRGVPNDHSGMELVVTRGAAFPNVTIAMPKGEYEQVVGAKIIINTNTFGNFSRDDFVVLESRSMKIPGLTITGYLFNATQALSQVYFEAIAEFPPFPSHSPSATVSALATRSPTLSSTRTGTGSASDTATRTGSGSGSETATRTGSGSVTATVTPSSLPSVTSPVTHTTTETGTGSASDTATRTGTGSASDTATRTGTGSTSETATRTGTLSPSATLTHTATGSGSGTETGTGSVTETTTPSSLPSVTPPVTRTATESESGTETGTGSGTKTGTKTATPSSLPSLTPPVTRTETGTETGSGSGTPTPPVSPSVTPSWMPSFNITHNGTFNGTMLAVAALAGASVAAVAGGAVAGTAAVATVGGTAAGVTAATNAAAAAAASSAAAGSAASGGAAGGAGAAAAVPVPVDPFTLFLQQHFTAETLGRMAATQAFKLLVRFTLRRMAGINDELPQTMVDRAKSQAVGCGISGLLQLADFIFPGAEAAFEIVGGLIKPAILTAMDENKRGAIKLAAEAAASAAMAAASALHARKSREEVQAAGRKAVEAKVAEAKAASTGKSRRVVVAGDAVAAVAAVAAGVGAFDQKAPSASATALRSEGKDDGRAGFGATSAIAARQEAAVSMQTLRAAAILKSRVNLRKSRASKVVGDGGGAAPLARHLTGSTRAESVSVGLIGMAASRSGSAGSDSGGSSVTAHPPSPSREEAIAAAGSVVKTSGTALEASTGTAKAGGVGFSASTGGKAVGSVVRKATATHAGADEPVSYANPMLRRTGGETKVTAAALDAFKRPGLAATIAASRHVPTGVVRG